MSAPGRRAALLVVALVVGFQLAGLGRDGLLSDASALRGTILWREELATVMASTIVNDYVRYFAPWAAFLRRGLLAGTLPLWNPYIGTGVPVAEALQPALFHPSTALLLVLPLEHALTALALARLALAALGAFVLARVLGCGPAGATVAGLLYAIEPFHLVLRFNTLPNVSACLPWLLAIGERRLRGASRRRTLAAWAFVAALAVLGGHSQTALHVLGAAWAYQLARSLAAGRPVRDGVAFLALGTLLAALGGLVAVWGHGEIVLDGFARTYRALRGAYPQLPLAHLASFLTPVGASGPQVAGYAGLLALALGAAGLAGRAAFPAWPWTLLALGAGAVAYGIPPVAAAVRALPVVGLADHSRLLIVVHLGLALLAARGVDCLGQARARRAMAAAAAALALGLAARALAGHAAWTLLAPAASLGFTAALLALVRAAPSARPAAAWLAVAFVAADLFAAHGPARRGGERAMPPVPPAFAPLAGRPEGPRALVANAIVPPNVPAFYEVSALAAFEPAMSNGTAELLVHAGLTPSFHMGVVAPAELRPAALRVLDLLGARTVLLPHPVAHPRVRQHLRELRREPVAVYENPHAFPRVFAAPSARLAADARQARALLADPAVDLRRTVVLEPPAPAPPDGAGGAAEATLDEYAPGRVRARARCAGPCWLVLTETWAPGWRAAVDGRPAPVLRAYRGLVAVALPPGEHAVLLAYRPRSVLVGAPVSLLVLAALAVAALRGARLAPGGADR